MIEKLYDAACATAVKRWPQGEAVAGAALTDKGSILTSIWVDASVDSACLCAETGAICEAHKLDEQITHIVCVSRKDENSEFVVLPSCGICQERLAVFGMDLEIAISGDRSGNVVFKTLAELRPNYWAKN